ncbi:unnamed protein product [Fraxinus pennsylvanica]|uniref:non-specific serine/threonine protein kinase n=1 Tax=Fraxinus pennsylvanica TaxID=56036 RepID=A0AAD2EE99_9LAMI|nr:unnamed protein product [Fraxinus pennsylvanica]
MGRSGFRFGFDLSFVWNFSHGYNNRREGQSLNKEENPFPPRESRVYKGHKPNLALIPSRMREPLVEIILIDHNIGHRSLRHSMGSLSFYWAQRFHRSRVKATAENVDEAVRELPDANLTPEDLWALHSQAVFPRPHKRDSTSWAAIRKITEAGEKIGLNHFKPVRPLGCGDTGSVHLVELKGTGLLFAMKAMDKSIMLNRNKVHRACIEREIISLLDHPFLPTLYTSFQTPTHVCLITDFCPGGELFAVLDKQPLKLFKEESARFYAAEVVIGLEYLHCLGIIYRDLKPENILLQKDGHVVLTDFDLSFKTACNPQILRHPPPKSRRSRSHPLPVFVAEPNTQSNSFVGTEEYIAPEIITGEGHSSAIDWWSLGILLYEMLYGRTPFRGKNRQKTFTNILHKDLTFPSSIPVTLAARQFINALLNRDPASRLGSNGGANEIKQHAFFRGINWPLIRCMTPPPLDVPLQLIGKEGGAKDVDWDEEGVLKTFANILHKDLTFPSSIPVTLAARQLINALLNRDPGSRLGSNGGANEIKQHPFFRGINWPLIRCMTPPPLDVPLQLIGKEGHAKDVDWDEEGVLVHPMELC